MIQRIQSFWLFIAALLNTGIIFMNFYQLPTINGIDSSVGVTNYDPALLLTVLIILLPLATIFKYKNRKQQLKMCYISIAGIISLVALQQVRIFALLKITPPTSAGSYWFGAVLLPLALLSIILAIVGIRKDDKLIKSVDRLR